MKKFVLAVVVAASALLAGCDDEQKLAALNAAIVTIESASSMNQATAAALDLYCVAGKHYPAMRPAIRNALAARALKEGVDGVRVAQFNCPE